MAKENMLMQVLEWLALVLVGISAINWGLVGLFNFNVVSWLAGLLMFPMLATILYILIGISGLYWVFYVARKEIFEGP